MARIFNSLLFKCRQIQRAPKASIPPEFLASGLYSTKHSLIGESLPSALLYEGNPGNAIDIAEFCKEKKVVIFGVPGAFTPGCSRTHLPGYVERYFEFKKKGVDEVVCVAVNDVFVLEAWGKFQDATGKVRMFADPNAIFTKALGVEMDAPKLGGIRSKRFSMVVDNGIITTFNVEPDSVGLSCSLAANLSL